MVSQWRKIKNNLGEMLKRTGISEFHFFMNLLIFIIRCPFFIMLGNVFALGVRAGFRSTKLSTQHKSSIEKLNLNLSTSPRMTPNAC